jgi:transposase
MNSCLSKITKVEIETFILPFISKNKRGFPSKVNPVEIIQWINHKLKTGCQWHCLFVDIEGFKPTYSWQLVYYYFRKWSKENVFLHLFNTFLILQEGRLDLENLNLDGTHSLAKKSGEAIGYQHRKKGRTSNVLIMTDGRGTPIALGNILSGNHNDLYDLVPQFTAMINDLKQKGICVENSMLNADKGFDSKSFRRCCMRKQIIPNIKENKRNRKKTKRGRKRQFNQLIYNRRFVNERGFAWMDSFKTLLIRFDTTMTSWINWHYLAFFLILIKV